MNRTFQEKLDVAVKYLLPIPFLGTPYWNVLLFPFGVHNNELLRQLIVYSATIFVTLVLFIKVVFLWTEKQNRRLIALTASLPAVYAIFYLLGILLRSCATKFLVDAATGGCAIVSCCSALLIIISEQRAKEFFRGARLYACISGPILLYYCVRFYLPGTDYYTNNLGVLSYMPLAYLCLTVCILMFLDAVLYQIRGNRWSKVTYLDFALFVLYAATLSLTMTKGPLLCLLFFAVLVPFFFRKKRHWYLFCGAALCCAVLFTTVLHPTQQDNRVTSTMLELGAATEELHTFDPNADPNADPNSESENLPLPDSIRSRLSYANIDEVFAIVQKADPTIMDNSYVHIIKIAYGRAPALLEEGVLTQTEYDRLYDMAHFLSNTSIGGRLFLWACALREISSAPLTGHGVLYFQSQYDTYPHNYFLEIGTDFGLMAMLAVLALGLFTFWQLLRRSRENPLLCAWLLYVFASLPRYMVGTSIYASDAFVQMGFCVVLMVLFRRTIPAEISPAP